jgi:two-component system, LytTR family, sensor kinase
MEAIFNNVCALVTAAFALTLIPSFRRRERCLLSGRDRGTALLVFLILGLAEEAAVRETAWFNHRVIAACSAGLLAGPIVGVVVSVFVTWLAVYHDHRPFAAVGISMFCGGLIGGWFHRWRPKLAQHPSTGFGLTVGISLLRNWLVFTYAPPAGTISKAFGEIGITPLLQGLGTALILAVVALVRERDEQARAAASAEVRALQAHMNPHFLFNASNAVAALATSE